MAGNIPTNACQLARMCDTVDALVALAKETLGYHLESLETAVPGLRMLVSALVEGYPNALPVEDVFAALAASAKTLLTARFEEDGFTATVAEYEFREDCAMLAEAIGSLSGGILPACLRGLDMLLYDAGAQQRISANGHEDFSPATQALNLYYAPVCEPAAAGRAR